MRWEIFMSTTKVKDQSQCYFKTFLQENCIKRFSKNVNSKKNNYDCNKTDI